MIANGRYPQALPARLIAAVEKAGGAGLTVDALRAMVEPRTYEHARETLGRLVSAGRIHGSGAQANRRWFVEVADALIWNEQRPRTDLEKREAVRTAGVAAKEQKRLARLAQLAEPRSRHSWTESQLATLRMVYPTGGVRVASEKTGQPVAAVRSKVSCLGLKCTQRPAYKRCDDAPPSRRERRRQRKAGQVGAALVVTAAPGPAVVHLKKVRGPADMPGEPIFTERTKWTIAPPAPQPMRTNTHSPI